MMTLFLSDYFASIEKDLLSVRSANAELEPQPHHFGSAGFAQ
jgi:hypothetical protein